MSQHVQIDMPGCLGVEVGHANGTRTMYKPTNPNHPVVTMPDRHADLMHGKAGISRYSKSYAMGISFDKDGNRIWE